MGPAREATARSGEGVGAAGVAGNRWRGSLDDALAAVPPDWAPLVRAWRQGPDGQRVARLIDERLSAGATVYPATPFEALALTRRSEVRAVILGQDPYHGPGQAEGLAFSVPAGLRKPPSLRNIDAELQRDLGIQPPVDGHLAAWARQGVLLLNTSLSVEDGAPGSHARAGWASLTQAVVDAVAESAAPCAFLLWGAHAQLAAAGVRARGQGRHAVLMANHPSPLSARRPPVPFLGCGHFSEANRFLTGAGRSPIDWRR